MEMFFGFLVGTLLIAVCVCIYFVKKLSDKVEMVKTDYRFFDRIIEDHAKDIMDIREKLREEDDGK